MNKGKISCILAAAMITTQFGPVAAFADNKTELISNVSAEDSSNETKYDNTQSFDEEPVNDQNNNDESKENQDSSRCRQFSSSPFKKMVEKQRAQRFKGSSISTRI